MHSLIEPIGSGSVLQIHKKSIDPAYVPAQSFISGTTDTSHLLATAFPPLPMLPATVALVYWHIQILSCAAPSEASKMLLPRLQGCQQKATLNLSAEIDLRYHTLAACSAATPTVLYAFTCSPVSFCSLNRSMKPSLRRIARTATKPRALLCGSYTKQTHFLMLSW